MKRILLALFLLPIMAFAQEEQADTTKIWTVGGNLNLNFSQVSLTNWVAGGKSSGTGILMTNISANYKKEKITWDNSADFSIGFTKEGENDLYKSDDKIDMNSKFGYNAKKNWYYSSFLNFKSQFADGYNYPDTENIISGFMSPGYLNIGLGMDYKVEKFTAMLSPISGKFTFVLDDKLSADGGFGVDPGKKTRSEMGATVKLDLNLEVVKNVTFQTKLDLFSNYFHNPENIDVDWNVLINMKINDFLSANLVTRLIYDDDIKIYDPESDTTAARVQFMEMFGAGLSLKF